MSKKQFLAKKIAHCYAHCKKIENVFAYSSRPGRDISKIPTDLDSARQKHFIRVKNLSKIMMHCYKLSKTFTVNISGSKFGKTKKVEITKWDLC
jgi:hypothetical protein